MNTQRTAWLATLLAAVFTLAGFAADEPAVDTSRGDQLLARYFALETAKLQSESLAEIKTADDWLAKRSQYRQQLLDMLGLDPLPAKTELKPVITGTLEHEEFIVEKLHYQSRPGLYVTANLYRPKKIDKPAPAILYVCGHGRVAKDGVSFGNKTHYQHHGAWLARNGYVCLVIDTLQLGEIEGLHHGTYKLNQWWWVNRSYTPAGVEAWNCIRALDYLQSRPEVDPDRLGVTGRSGGGAYSWWIASLDDRIKCAVPVAGITDLTNHVVDGCVEGHCDCMYMVNAYRWDYAQVAALVSPRPLLISNTDTDAIFPLNGVVRLYEQTRRIYRLQNAADKVGLNITAGGHIDTQELQVAALRWFDQNLRGEKDRKIETAAVKFFDPAQLKVFDKLPADQVNTEIQESFVSLPKHAPVNDKAEWEKRGDTWLAQLKEKTFRGWPAEMPLDLKQAWSAEKNGVRMTAYDFTSQEPYRLRLYVAQRAGLEKLDLVVLNVLDDRSWKEFLGTWRTKFADELKDETAVPTNEEAFTAEQQMFENFAWGMAYVAPRGVGPTAFDAAEKKQTQNRRRFYLLGQTLEGMQTWDVRRGIQALQSLPVSRETPVWLQSQRQMAGVALYASLFEKVKRLDLHELPRSHRDGPYFLNVERIFDLPQAVTLAADSAQVVLYGEKTDDFTYARQTEEKLGWEAKRLQFRLPVEKGKK